LPSLCFLLVSVNAKAAETANTFIYVSAHYSDKMMIYQANFADLALAAAKI
jgi:hypothetical protein